MEILDEREWRISRSGFSIRTGWGHEKKIIAKYGGGFPLDPAEYQEWLANAENICDFHNASLAPLSATPSHTGRTPVLARRDKQRNGDGS